MHLSPKTTATLGRPATPARPAPAPYKARPTHPELRGARLRRDSRGAVYVEFLIAFLPVFVFFLVLLQLALLTAHKLIVQHAAIQGARAAAVVYGDEPTEYGETQSAVNTMSHQRRQVVRDAVLLSLAPLITNGNLTDVNVVNAAGDQPGGADQPEDTALTPMGRSKVGMVRVRVEATVLCKIAIANSIMCGGLPIPGWTPSITIPAEGIFPYQGARYEYTAEQ